MSKWLYIKNLLYYIWYKNYRIHIKNSKAYGEVWNFEKGKIIVRVLYRDSIGWETYNYNELINLLKNY